MLRHFLKPRIKNPTGGNFQFVPGIDFSPGAELMGAESTVSDPAFLTSVFPQWNFSPLEVLQPPMVWQGLSLPESDPQGYPFGGIESTGLTKPSDMPDINGDYYE